MLSYVNEAKTVLRGKCMVLNSFQVKTSEIINKLNIQLKKLGK